MIVAILTAFMVGLMIGAWWILVLFSVNPMLAIAWRRRRK